MSEEDKGEQKEELKEIAEEDLPAGAHALWLKTISAVEMANHKYAVSLAQAVLKEAPGYVDGRRVLRKSAAIVAGSAAGKKSFLGRAAAD